MNNIINSLINDHPFTYEERVELKNNIPKPDVIINTVDGKITRKFQKKWYSDFKWLCGDVTSNKLYCFYCLLCGGASKSSSNWSTVGIDSVKNFVKKAETHGNSKSHIFASEAFILLGKRRIDLVISSAAKENALKHNEAVRKNRKYIRRLFDVVFFLSKQDLPFRGHDESENSQNKGNYRELLELLAMEEPIMERQLQTSTSFKGLSSEIQNELIKIMSNNVNTYIKKELKKAPFISIQADETTDVSCMSQLSVIFRYVVESQICERFIGFYDVSDSKDAQSIADILIQIIEEYEIGDKLCSQTYDGATVMAGRYNGVNSIIKNRYNKAIFVHCYAHQLNLVLMHGCKNLKFVDDFISSLSQFHNFFYRSTSRMSLIKKHGFSIPSSPETRWNFKSRAVETIKKITAF